MAGSIARRGFGNKMCSNVQTRGGWEFSKVLIWRGVTEWQFVETETIHKGRSVWTKLPTQSKKQKNRKASKKTKQQKKREEQRVVRETAPFRQSWRKKLRGLAQRDSRLSHWKRQFMQKVFLEQNCTVKVEQNNTKQTCWVWSLAMNHSWTF